MKLCRFELTESPGQVRSGLFYDQRIYETDGQNAIGIHDPGSIILRPPLGAPPAIRLFDLARDAHGDARPTYRYQHGGYLVPPAGTVSMSSESAGLDFEVRLSMVVSDFGERVEANEVDSFILGHSICIVLTDPDDLEGEALWGGPGVIGRDHGTAFGPFVVTPDELVGQRDPVDSRLARHQWTIRVNGEVLFDESQAAVLAAEEVFALATRNHAVYAGEVLAFPPLERPDLISTSLGRLLLPGDRLSVEAEGIGNLVLNIA